MSQTATPDAEAPEGTQEPQAEPQGAPEAAEAPESSERPPEPEQAAEVVKHDRDVVVQTPAGSLTLRPNQKELDVEQHWALKAIGIDTAADPGVIPHLRAFVHMCQIRALDPFAREAYLIGRGKGDKRKYTMQTGIDGYRKMAGMTGRFIRVKATYWTGEDDDDRSYRMVEVDGDYVMKRVWYDQWPAARGNPGAAKVVIEHFDDDGLITTTNAVADWGMYAPYNDEWEDKPGGGRRPKRNPDGSVVQTLNDMWTKGGPHMLAKCAEALAHRRAFPNAVNGFYVTEEMHRLDSDERSRKAAERSDERRRAFEARQTPVVEVAKDAEPAEQGGKDVVDAQIVEEPATAAEAVVEVVAEMSGDETEALRLLRAELDWQADVLGQSPTALAKRWVARYRKNLDDFNAAEILPLVNGLRTMVAGAARNAGLPEAEAYAQTAVDGAGPIDVEALSPEDAPDPDAEHPFAGDDEQCLTCGLAEGVGNHPEDRS